MLCNFSFIVIVPDLTINRIQNNCAYSKYQSLRRTERDKDTADHRERTIKVIKKSRMIQLIIIALCSLSVSQWKKYTNAYLLSLACNWSTHRKYMSFITLSICHSKNETLYSFMMITEHTKYRSWDCNFRL